MYVWLERWKSGRVEKNLFGWREKREDEKCNLYKLTIMSLNVIWNKKINKKQYINEEYNEDKKQ